MTTSQCRWKYKCANHSVYCTAKNITSLSPGSPANQSHPSSQTRASCYANPVPRKRDAKLFSGETITKVFISHHLVVGCRVSAAKSLLHAPELK